MSTDQALSLTDVKEYIWNRYIDLEDVEAELDEDELLDFFRDYYTRVSIETDDDSFYFGVLMFEKAWETPDRKEEYFFLAHQVFHIYRERTGETDWDAVEDRLEEIQDFFEEEGLDLVELAETYSLPAPPVEEKDELEALEEAAPEGMALVPPAEVAVPGVEERVHVDSFYIDRHPTTVGQFQRFLESTQYRAPKYWGEKAFTDKEQPVVGVSFFDAEKFAEWAGKELPTHEQWIASARDGDEKPYPFGEAMDASKANCASSENEEPVLEPVGTHPEGASEIGVEDLLGGVWEWTSSWYGGEEEFKVIKGGSYVDPPDLLSIETVLYASPKEKIDNVGFRCVRPVKGVR